MYGGQKIVTGNIIIRQKGSKVRAGVGVLESKDFTLMALKDGTVKFFLKNGQQYVSVV